MIPAAAQKKTGRKPIGERAMTPAERKARSRAQIIGSLAGHIDQAAREARKLRRALVNLPFPLPPEVLESLVQLELQVSLARSAVPES